MILKPQFDFHLDNKDTGISGIRVYRKKTNFARFSLYESFLEIAKFYDTDGLIETLF